MLVKSDQGACHATISALRMKNGDNNEHTESSRGQQREDNAVAWPVALENLAFDQRLAGIWSQLLPNLFLSLSEGQSLGLSEEVGEEDTVVEGVADRVESSSRGNKICGNKLRSLVNELVERVLSVGSSSAPDDRLKHHNDQQSLEGC